MSKKKTTKFKSLPKRTLFPDAERRVGLRLELPLEVYRGMLRWLSYNSPKECAGFAEVINERVTWAWWDKEARMTGGSVDSSQGRGLVAALMSGKTVNLQWHTHPSLEAYWSSTDVRDQHKLIGELIDEKTGSPFGEYFVIVFNSENFVVRKFVWENHQVTLIHDGHCTLGGTVLNKPRHTYPSGAWSYLKSKIGFIDGEAGEEERFGEDTFYETGDFNSHVYKAGVYDWWNGDEEGDWWWNNDDPSSYRKLGTGGERTYDPLFEATGVQKDDFAALREKLEGDFGEDAYLEIIYDTDLWPDIAGYYQSGG